MALTSCTKRGPDPHGAQNHLLSSGAQAALMHQKNMSPTKKSFVLE
jgi:hypothetical protein